MSYATNTSGPQIRKCPTCNGTGINPMLVTVVCPKCKGERVLIVDRYR